MQVIAGFRDASKNALVWILLALLVVLGWENGEQRRLLAHLCMLHEPHSVVIGVPRTPKEQVDHICITGRLESE